MMLVLPNHISGQRRIHVSCNSLRKIGLGTVILAKLLALTLSAQVSVEVSPKYSAISYSNSLSLASDEKEIFELPGPPMKDTYQLIYSVNPGVLNIVVFDRINFINQNPDPVFLVNKSITGTSLLPLPIGSSKEGLVISLINDSSQTTGLDYTVFRIGNRSPNVVLQLKNVVEAPILAMNEFYRLPKFKLVVIPCGSVNAYSSPDIVICSELIADLYEKDLTGALYPIIYHEMAHTLLNLWNLPGFDNEDIADEFAAAMLARAFPNRIKDFITYLENKDSTTEAIIQLTKGSRHTLSIQRARNMRVAIGKISQIEKRWETLLKPFERVKSFRNKKNN